MLFLSFTWYCMGADLKRYWKGIILLSVVFTNVLILPYIFLFQLLDAIDNQKWKLYFQNSMYLSLTFLNDIDKIIRFPIIGGFIGCLLGSYILALDWYKPYQEFPLPCLLGLFAGFTVGSAFTIFMLACFEHHKSD
ncbi:hypothetical protein RFI_02483 [Reticulomyxa filosa]|uniref:Uncharacterized protein n=1 Tax=Reticulomyxa filosa TaxID=46433 RepID=X6PAD2_RETFI|nr:hypothetical protein RFI_02483 [Reticulomyxa filosa]|eukprot:ETO34607.1 hypothetical protein RFI_02483 [Reticulomyxa filosa]